MRIIILGTGAALPDPDRMHSSILITVEGCHYLFDCGTGATHQMIRADVNPAEVDAVFLSHLHFDHIIDFPFFMLSSWIINRQNPPLVVGPAGTRRFVDSLFENGAFHTDIVARARYPRRQENLHVLKPDVREVGPGPVYEDARVRISACHVEHIPREISPCLGLRLDTADGKSVSFSGDTAPCDRFVALSRGVDLMIHECTFPRFALEWREQAGIGISAHTSPAELGELAVRAGVKSLVATHFGHFDTTRPVLKEVLAQHMPIDNVGPDAMQEVAQDIRRTWKGDLRLAHDLMRIDL